MRSQGKIQVRQLNVTTKATPRRAIKTNDAIEIDSDSQEFVVCAVSENNRKNKNPSIAVEETR